jgi:hypothetical protein
VRGARWSARGPTKSPFPPLRPLNLVLVCFQRQAEDVADQKRASLGEHHDMELSVRTNKRHHHHLSGFGAWKRLSGMGQCASLGEFAFVGCHDSVPCLCVRATSYDVACTHDFTAWYLLEHNSHRQVVARADRSNVERVLLCLVDAATGWPVSCPRCAASRLTAAPG